MNAAAVAALAVLLILPVTPALASVVVSPGELMVTDFFLWPNWRQILAEYDCTPELAFYFWNLPPLVEPIVEPPPIADVSPIAVEPPPPVIAPPPIIVAPTPIAVIPEPATWAMMLLGFAGLILAAARRRCRHADVWT